MADLAELAEIPAENGRQDLPVKVMGYFKSMARGE
jgi:hypothetical protein